MEMKRRNRQKMTTEMHTQRKMPTTEDTVVGYEFDGRWSNTSEIKYEPTRTTSTGCNPIKSQVKIYDDPQLPGYPSSG